MRSSSVIRCSRALPGCKADRGDVLGDEERARAVFRRVAHGVQPLTVAEPERHLHRVLDAVGVTCGFHEADGLLNCAQRIVLEPERQGEVEERF